MKKCTKCKIIKSRDLFYKEKKQKDGLSTWCKSCHFTYTHSINGVIIQIYSAQKKTSTKRKHSMPKYTKNELSKYLLNNKKFVKLYDNWVKSGYQKKMKPSIDRLDDYRGYCFDNIQIVTWEENCRKGFLDRKNGINNKINKRVYQFDINGRNLDTFFSISEAVRKTGIDQGSISKVVNGKRKTAGGFKWHTTPDLEDMKQIAKDNWDIYNA